MPYVIRNHKILATPLFMSVMLFALIISLTSCDKLEKPAAQKTFASPADAGAAFLEAAKSGDRGAL
ncbi:MAG TPA: hypothetical protein VF742_07875, partial [Terracidiphilus sp.]